MSRHRLIISCQRIFEDHSGRGLVGEGGRGGGYNGRATEEERKLAIQTVRGSIRATNGSTFSR